MEQTINAAEICVSSANTRTPSLYTLEQDPEARAKYFSQCVPMHKASQRGDWEAAKHIISLDPSIIRASITKGWQTPLHVAAGFGHISFVKNLMELLTEEDLVLQDKKGNTAFCFVVAAGNIPIAELMTKKNPILVQIQGPDGLTPLSLATLFGHEKMARYLYPKLRKCIDEGERTGVFFTCINNGLYDLALEILEDNRELSVARDKNNETALHLLARKPSIFAIKSSGWRRLLNCGTYKGKYLTTTPGHQLLKVLWEAVLWQHDAIVNNLMRKPSHVLFIATKSGNFKFVAELIGSYPDLIWETDENRRSIFHVAAMYHQSSIFNLLLQLGLYKEFLLSVTDAENNNILHLAAKLCPQHQRDTVAGPALQMQGDLLWFEEVKKAVPSFYLEKKNIDDKTPRDIFTEEHKGLLEKGESWMKNLASSGTLVSTLIAISMFASAVSLHAGVSDDRETVNGLAGLAVSSFLIVDTLAFVSSTIGMFTFFSILTSPFKEDEFRKSLPLKLLIGLITLFISSLAMMASFSLAYTISYQGRKILVRLVFPLAYFLLIYCFYRLHYPLATYVLSSICNPKFRFRLNTRLSSTLHADEVVHDEV